MAVAHGYSSIATSGSVFIYDTGDTFNSYKGEPTSNISNGLEGHGGSWVLQSQTYNGAPVYRNTVTSPSTFNNFGFRSTTQVNLNQSGPKYLTISFYANVIVSPGSLYGYITVRFTDNSTEQYSWTYNPSNWATTNIGQWQFVKATVALNPAKTPQNTVVWYVYRDNATEGVVDFGAIQLEQKDHPTPYVAIGTSRSNTQGLLDISGVGNSISLANMSFNSSAQMVFDGTDDYINTSTTLGANCTLELVIQSSNYSNKIPISLDGDNYASGPNIFFSGNVISWNTGDSAANFFSNSSYPNSNYHHIVVTNTSGVSAILYIDGVQIGTANSLNATTTGANKLWIGRFHGDNNYTIAGNIPVAKVYNRALTAGEVLNNFNHYKTRFNIN